MQNYSSAQISRATKLRNIRIAAAPKIRSTSDFSHTLTKDDCTESLPRSHATRPETNHARITRHCQMQFRQWSGETANAVHH